MSRKILIIDDEKNIRDLIKYNLQAEGFKVIEASDGQGGLDKLNEEIDLVVLDLMLPGIDGLEVCKKIRSNNKKNDIPIIMLTARSGEIDRVIGLEIGADDYLVKPFSPRELIARIKAILRRVSVKNDSAAGKSTLLNRGEISLDTASYEVRKKNEIIELAPKEFELLKILLINCNQVLSRDLLLEKIWGFQYAGDTRTVDVHIRRLRSKIGEKYITTVRGVGYKFVELE